MRNFLINNWVSITIVGLFFIYCIRLIVTRQWDRLRKDAYKLMLKAERVIKGTKQGQIRMNTVMTIFYSNLPWWLKFFYTEKDIREKLQDWFDLAKDGLDDGKLNNSIKGI